jgi:hypothetical protein
MNQRLHSWAGRWLRRPLNLVTLPMILIPLLGDAASGQSLPLGVLTVTGTPSGDCPPGFTCTGFTVAAPGVTNNAPGWFAVAPHTAAEPRGMVVLFTGSGGQRWWTNGMSELLTFTEDLRAEGFTVVQVKWGTNWLESSPGNEAGQARLAARPATVIKYIHDAIYQPMNLPPRPVGDGGFVVTGNSGGASQVAYALSHYGLEDILDVVIPTGGPPHSNISRAVLETNPSEPGRFSPQTRDFIDRGWGFFNGNGPAAQQDPAYRPKWDAASVGVGGRDFFHPNTRIHLIQGSNDLQMQALASDYHARLIQAGSPFVGWEIADNTPHATYSTPEGRAAIWNAITARFHWGDANLDGRVDIADLGILAVNWQQTGRYWHQGDVNRDGMVDIADLGILAANWQAGAGGGAMGIAEAMAMFDLFDGVVIPEPALPALLGSIPWMMLRRGGRASRR